MRINLQIINVMKNSNKKQLAITFRKGDRPRLKTEPNSRTKPHFQHHHNSHNSYLNEEHFSGNKDNLTLPTLHKFNTDHVRAKTLQKFTEPSHEIRHVNRTKTIERQIQNQQQKQREQSQSDKILNQFLINYFKKKNKFALKARASKLKKQHPYQPDFLKQTHKNKKQRSPEKAALVTNSIDAYFNVNSLIQ